MIAAMIVIKLLVAFFATFAQMEVREPRTQLRQMDMGVIRTQQVQDDIVRHWTF